MSTYGDRDDSLSFIRGDMSNNKSIPQIMFDPAKLKLVDPKILKKDPKNRNKHSPEQVERMCKLFQKFGMRWPILVSQRTGVIKAGEGRLLAALKLGMPQVLVSYQDFDSDDTEYAFGVSDNAISLWADLDIDSIQSDIMNDLGEDFDIDLLAIEHLDMQIDDLPSAEDLANETVDEVNRGDENSEWVGMPDFESGGKYINLTFQFKTEEDRKQYCETNSIIIDKKNSGQWIVYK